PELETLKERCRKYQGTAKINISQITFPTSLSQYLSEKNVKRLCGIFDMEDCRRLDSANYVSAVVDGPLTCIRMTLIWIFKLASLTDIATRGFQTMVKFKLKPANIEIKQMHASRIDGCRGCQTTKHGGFAD
ncbi:hypothetical protein N7539_008679, partial [Penicillium diatomitis]